MRKTNNGNNLIYIVNEINSPNVVREIGRLREVTFRDAGGGTGEEIDLDAYDYGEHGFEQMIVWDPREKEITGGYRYIDCKNLVIDGTIVHSPTADLFRYSKKFIDKYLAIHYRVGPFICTAIVSTCI